MAGNRDPSGDLTPLDDRTLRLGREWFAEVRAKNPPEEDPKRRKRGDDGDAGDGSWLDRLFDSDADGGD